MNIVLDVGNTLIKVAVFEGDRMGKVHKFEHNNYADLMQFIANVGTNCDKNSSHKALISSTVGEIEGLSAVLERFFDVVTFDNKIKLPIINSYSTKTTLGYDRVASVIGGQSLFVGCSVLTINLGTCIIYDFINSDKEYIGGGISLGLSQRLRSLTHFTAKLPLIDLDTSFSDIELIGKTTKDSILSGVVYGVKFEIEGFVNKYKSKYKDLKVIISGGDLRYMKGVIDCEYEYIDNLIIIGLHEVLKYNRK